MANQHEARRIQRVPTVLVVLFWILAVEPVCNDFTIGNCTDAVTLLQMRASVLTEVDAAVPHAVRTERIESIFSSR